MMRPAWRTLPNSALIDQVLAELKANTEKFVMAYTKVRYAPRSLAPEDLAAWEAACDAARSAAWRQVQLGDNHSAAATVAQNAILALIAYNDSPKYLDMSYEKLKVWIEISEHPAAILLLPYVWVREQIAS